MKENGTEPRPGMSAGQGRRRMLSMSDGFMAMHCSGANGTGNNVSMGLTFQKDNPIAEFFVDSAGEHYYFNYSSSNIF